MGSYRPLFSVAVEHQFFSDAVPLGLKFVPTPKTVTMLQCTGMLLKNTTKGISCFYDEANAETLGRDAAGQDEAWTIGFKVFSSDSAFANYTELFRHREDAILYFDNRNGTDDVTGMVRLHHEEYVAEENLQSVTSPSLEELLTKKDRLVRPLCLVNLWMTERERGVLASLAHTPAGVYVIKFKARQTFWKYYVLGKLSRRRLSIVDLDNKIEFEYAGNTSLSDDRTAITFRSHEAISLSARSDYRIQLKEAGPSGAKVLIPRLPVPNASRLHKETLDGQEILVSELYINY
ncbi:hypothetical protein [Nitrospira sp. Nam74]